MNDRAIEKYSEKHITSERNIASEDAWFIGDLVCPETRAPLQVMRDGSGEILNLQTVDASSSYPVRGGVAYLLKPDFDYFKYLITTNQDKDA
jgi:uncharacterized protein YbaR (Trm112 family)